MPARYSGSLKDYITLKNYFLLLILALGTLAAKSQGREVIREYINSYRLIAIEEMQRTGVPAAIKLAQGIHETTAGTSDLVQRSNNHFGIKCKSNWTGESVSHTDDAPDECFRKYPNAEDSYRDHSNFLKNNQRYAALFRLNGEDYRGWAYGLKKAGYATNPKYPLLLIKLIEEYGLQDYTLMALGKKEIPLQEWAAGTNEGPQTGVIAVVQAEMENEEVLPLTASLKEYPDTEFRINETRVVYAKEGTSLLSLALRYDIPLKRLFEFNEMAEQEAISRPQLIFLQRKRKTGDTDFHVVKAGESLYDIAQERGMRMDALRELNHLTADMLPAAGAQLYLKKKADAPPPLVSDKRGARLSR